MKTHLHAASAYEPSSKWRSATCLSITIAAVNERREVTTGGSAPGHFTQPLYEAVNLAPFVTSFSTRLMAS